MTAIGATVLFRSNENTDSRERQEGEVTAREADNPEAPEEDRTYTLTILHNGQTYERAESACIGRG